MAETTDASIDAPRRLPFRAVIVVLILVAVAALAWWLLRSREHQESFTGYVVSDNIYMASPVAGTLTSVAVERGQRIEAGAALFRVDPTVRAAQATQARATITANEAQVEQQRASLARARADLAAAQADADRFGAELRRLEASQRDKQGSVAQLNIDDTRASYQGALRRRDAARTQLNSASSAIAGAEAQVDQARAGLTSAQRELDELSPPSPSAGRIEDVMFRPGESIKADVPIVSIVPDGRVKVRFYVPQRLVNSYGPGRKVAIACDGCPAGMTAKVEFVATEPEYTPPVIYSLDAREKLVFLVEAVPENPRLLRPGQPMDVAPSANDLPER